MMKVVKQHDLKDCGASCLLSIIRYYKGNVSLEKIRLDTNTTKEGTTALNLLIAARKYGFEATGVKVDSLHNDLIKLPAIAHIITKDGLEHFVVITKINSSSVYLMDPAKGKVIMKEEEFKVLWDNVLLMFYPKMPIIFNPKENSLGEVFLKIIGQEKKLFLSILGISLILSALIIGHSFYFKIVLEAISLNKDLRFIKILIICFSSILVFKLLFTAMRRSLENHLNKNIDVLLLTNFITHIFNIPLRSIATRTSGEVMTRIKELIGIKSLFTDIFINVVLDLILGLVTIPILYKLNDNLFWIIFFLVVIYLLVGLIASKLIYQKAYHNIEMEERFNSTLLEEITLLTSLKNLDLTKEALHQIESKLAPFLYDNFKVMQFFNSQNNLKEWLNEIGLFIINSVGFILIYQNKLSIANLITFNTLVTYFFNPFKNIIDTLPRYNFLQASFAKINEFLSIEEEKYGQAITILNPSLKITNLKYSYDNYNLVINDLNTEVKNGDFVLLKGPSGTGKSTLCKILTKVLTDYKGNIYINNINILDYNLATIRQNITYISQNEALFTGTIRENICMGRIIENDALAKVCEVCEIETIVAKKPLRYETIITNESNFISGGERQRIILARALLKSSGIYLIDEALSEVDYEMERRIIGNIKKYLKGKIVIYITHKQQDDLFKKMISLEDYNGL